jgi:hypothetical protein
LTKPEGIYIPYSYNPNSFQQNNKTSYAETREVVSALTYLIGLGGSCVLNRENLTLNDLILNLNQSNSNHHIFNESFFGKINSSYSSCKLVFNHDADISNDYFNLTLKYEKKLGKKYYPECSCMSDNSGFVCSYDNFNLPPQFHTLTHETLLNITGENETEYYLYTTDLYRLKRYGGLSFDNEEKFKSNKDKQMKLDNLKENELVQNLLKHSLGK